MQFHFLNCSALECSINQYENAKKQKNLQSLLQCLSHIFLLMMQKTTVLYCSTESLISSAQFCFILPKMRAIINNSIRHFLLNHQGFINYKRL